MGFTLNTRGYAVRVAADMETCKSLVSSFVPEALVIRGPVPELVDLMERVKESLPDCRSLVLDAPAEFDGAGLVDSIISPNMTTLVLVLERLRILLARKRGPKKVSASAAPAVARAA